MVLIRQDQVCAVSCMGIVSKYSLTAARLLLTQVQPMILSSCNANSLYDKICATFSRHGCKQYIGKSLRFWYTI